MPQKDPNWGFALGGHSHTPAFLLKVFTDDGLTGLGYTNASATHHGVTPGGTQGALQIYKRLMHQEFEEINAEIIDGMGELTNIISGRTRYELEKENIHLYAHVPIVFFGRNAEVNYITKTAVLSVPFSFAIDGIESRMNVDFVFG